MGSTVLLVHPGGPFFRNKDQGAWSIPKGEVEPDEEWLAAARREFEEEIGTVPVGPFAALTPVKQSGGKIEVIAGVNLPMLIKLAASRTSTDLTGVAQEMREHGRNAIWVASDFLRGEKSSA